MGKIIGWLLALPFKILGWLLMLPFKILGAILKDIFSFRVHVKM